MEKVPDDIRAMLESIDRRLKAVKHAFSVEPLEGMTDCWLWTCACGEHIIQLDGDNVQQRIIAHVRGLA